MLFCIHTWFELKASSSSCLPSREMPLDRTRRILKEGEWGEREGGGASRRGSAVFHWLIVCKKVNIGSDTSGQAAKKHFQTERGQSGEIESIFSLIPDSPAQPTLRYVAQCGQRHLVATQILPFCQRNALFLLCSPLLPVPVEARGWVVPGLQAGVLLPQLGRGVSLLQTAGLCGGQEHLLSLVRGGSKEEREGRKGVGGQTAGLGAGQENLLTLGRGGMRLGTEGGREGGAGQLGLVEDRSSC